MAQRRWRMESKDTWRPRCYCPLAASSFPIQTRYLADTRVRHAQPCQLSQKSTVVSPNWYCRMSVFA